MVAYAYFHLFSSPFFHVTLIENHSCGHGHHRMLLLLQCLLLQSYNRETKRRVQRTRENHSHNISNANFQLLLVEPLDYSAFLNLIRSTLSWRNLLSTIACYGTFLACLFQQSVTMMDFFTFKDFGVQAQCWAIQFKANVSKFLGEFCQIEVFCLIQSGLDSI